MPAVIEASDQSPLFSPDGAQISQLHVSPGDSVKQEDVLISLESMTLTSQIVEAQRRIDLGTVHGTLLAQGQGESLALRFWRRAVHVILREVVI